MSSLTTKPRAELTRWQQFWQSKKNQQRVTLTVKYVLAFIILAFSLIPVIYTVSSAFNPVQAPSSKIIPDNATLANFREILTERPFTLWLWNTTKIATISSIFSAMITTLTAFAFSRYRFAGRGKLLLAILIIQVFPVLMAMVALFTLLDQLGGCCIPWLGLNTHNGLIMIYTGGAMGINIWLMKGFFDSIPRDIDESGMIDGASDWQRFWQLIFPLARPIVVVIAILTFFFVYSDWILPTIMLRSSDQYTLMVGLQLLISNEYDNAWSVFAAGAVLGSLLPVAIYILLRDQIVGGLTSGSVKG